MTRVSVVMPAYNRQAVIGRAIDSVLQQDFADFELLVVDDGSTDRTAEAVTATADPRVRLIRQAANSGGNAARNRGIMEAGAPLVALLDSDDAFLPNKLSAVVGRFDAQPDLGTLLDSYHVIHPDKYGGKPQPRINPVVETSEVFLPLLFDTSIKARRLRKSASGITVRRDVAITAGRASPRSPDAPPRTNACGPSTRWRMASLRPATDSWPRRSSCAGATRNISRTGR